MAKIFLVVGARPNIVKAAPLYNTLITLDFCEVRIIHTGQHYDFDMSDVFFRDFELPGPHEYLGVGSGTHGRQTGEMLIKLEDYFVREKPDIVVVFGDTNSTLAGALAAAKLAIKVAHVEAGARSFDLRMPEELNRVLTDRISDILFAPDKYGEMNLIKEGIPRERIYNVGNILMDNLYRNKQKIDGKKTEVLQKFGLRKLQYGIVTIHRANNVDDASKLKAVVEILNEISERFTLIFPIHPRTRKRLENFELHLSEKIILTDPLSYLEFGSLLSDAAFVLTDSGGIQTESYFFNVPCLTMRENTEWVSTLESGTNFLVGFDLNRIINTLGMLSMKGFRPEKKEIPEWDGRTSERIAQILMNFLSGSLKN